MSAANAMKREVRMEVTKKAKKKPLGERPRGFFDNSIDQKSLQELGRYLASTGLVARHRSSI
jgi:hypothetical protein